MKEITYRIAEQELRRIYWFPVRQKGAHVQFQSPNQPGTLVIPCHGTGTVLSPNVVKSIERTTGLSLRR